ncbi:glycosyltransferase [Glutamicibacter endophyticus]
MRNPLEAIAIVIPVHNEEELIAGCLRSVRTAMDHFAAQHPRVTIGATFVLDSCTDQTPWIVQDRMLDDPRLSMLEVQLGNVGASRAAGVRYALQGLDHCRRPQSVWLACTDADTRVPVHWLTAMAGSRAAGADAVAGTVQPDRQELDAELYRLWRAAYRPVDGHHHIHGANLGVSAAAYEAVGGFPPLAAREDVALVAALRTAGYRIDASAQLQAITSGRLRGRLREGFADYLAALDGQGARID